MITARRTRLVRVPDLHTFRQAIRALATAPGAAASERLVIVPTRAAACQAQRSSRDPELHAQFVTREQLYERLHDRLTHPQRPLSAIERDAIAGRAAAHAAALVPGLSFQLRPGLVAEMLRFYDLLRRHSQTVTRFEELMTEALGDTSSDRGVDRMFSQTRFLAETFREYERLVSSSGACDEHVLRDRLKAEIAAGPIRHVIVTVADWIADPDGLFVADFDLLSRLPGVEAIDLICTESVLGSGFHQRLDGWWPGVEEVRGEEIGGIFARPRPTLLTPSDAPSEQAWVVHRDRHEELVEFTHFVKRGVADPFLALVYKRPLPYLYLAPETLGAAAVRYHTADALPLAAEPTAAALDVVLDVVEANFTRDALVALLETPHLAFFDRGEPISRRAVAVLNRALCELRYLGDISRLAAIASAGLPPAFIEGTPALDCAVAAALELVPLVEPAPASQQLQRLLAFVTSHASVPKPDDPIEARHSRTRAMLVDLLTRLAAAHAVHHDPAWTIEDLGGAIRRWIQDETVDPDSTDRGAHVHLVDDQAARYGEFDAISIVGLIQQEWPEAPRRNIFYPPSLLRALGWPSEKERRSGADARFLDLMGSASGHVMLSTFTLDNETLVPRSLQLDEVARARLPTRAVQERQRGLLLQDDELTTESIRIERLPETAREWLQLRLRRSPATAPDFHGYLGAQTASAWSVSALETYLGCPFKFYAQHVLRLSEDPDDEEMMDPRRQGQIVHAVFEAFFKEWQASGHGAITRENLDEARAMFTVVVERSLIGLSEAEGGLERTRLLGSSAAAGLGEAVFRMEAERPAAVIKRLLEYPLRGEFEITTSTGRRTASLIGKADRLDLLADGTFRLIDYKLGWPPDRTRALQLAIYGVCAEQHFRKTGKPLILGEAAYLAFKGPRRVVPLFSTASARDEVLAQAQQRLADTLSAIERGEFPPTPDDVFRCETCSFDSVCRRDYVGDV